MARERRKTALPMYFEKTSPTRFSPGDPKMYCADEWATDLKSRQPAQVSDELARATAEPRTAGEEKANRNSPGLEISGRRSKHSTSLFLTATRNPLQEFSLSLHCTASGSLFPAFLCALFTLSQNEGRVSAVAASALVYPEGAKPRLLRPGWGCGTRGCLLAPVPLPYNGAIRRGVAVIPESNIGRQLHGD